MDFFEKKLPYECISHIGAKMEPMQKLQMYCDIAATLGYGDNAKLRTLLGILFTQRSCAEGHYIGEVSKNDFDAMVDDAINRANIADCCENIPRLYGVENELCECDICPCSTRYRNATYEEELEVVKYIYNRGNVDGTLITGATYIEIVRSSGIELRSLVEISGKSECDNGVVVPLMSIMMSSALSWFGDDRTDWYIDNVLKIQLKNKKVNVLYPAQNSTRLLNEKEIEYCVNFFKTQIMVRGDCDYNDTDKFRELVSTIKRKQRNGYVPFGTAVTKKTADKAAPKKRKSKKKEPEAVTMNLLDFFIVDADTDTPHIPYSEVNVTVQDVQNEEHEVKGEKTECGESVSNEDDRTVSDSVEREVLPTEPVTTNETENNYAAGEIAEYVRRIESPMECVWIQAHRSYFDRLTVIDDDNKDYLNITLNRELVVRKVIACDYIKLDDDDGMLLYLGEAQERKFDEQFYFIRKKYISDKLISVLKNGTITKLTLSPIALAAYMSEYCMCDNMYSLCDVYMLCRGQAATLKALGDGKGDGDHIVRVFRNLIGMYEGAAKTLDAEKIKLIGAYHCALALSLNAGQYVKGCSIDYDGSVVRYTYADEIISPGIVMSVESIQLPMTCEVGIPEITRAIIARLYRGRYVYDGQIKVLDETSDGYTLYIPAEGDATGMVDVINRITVNVLREMTSCRPEYTVDYKGIKL